MKKIFTLGAILVFNINQAQNLFTENFDVFPTTWIKTNQSQPVGPSNWSQGSGTAFNPGGFNGGATSFSLVNYNSVAPGMAGTISNWLITPVVNLKDGDVIKFYSREGGNFNNIPDRMEMRLSTNGVQSLIPSSGSSDLGSFTTLAITINPNLLPSVYPVTWTQYSYTVTGLSAATDCKIAFRYYVTNGGPNGANGNVIGVDAFSVDRPLSTNDFFKGNFAVFPNPVNDVLNLTNSKNIAITATQITDINGRVVKEIKGNTVAQINISDLNAGVYFLKITTDQGVGTTKIIKK